MNFEKAIEYVKTVFDQHPEHLIKYKYREKFGHTLRVYKIAQKLLETEVADADIVLMGTIFHDSGYTINEKNHMKISADICRAYLTDNNYNDDYIEKVCEIIVNHDNKKLLHEKDVSIEQILLIEADNLDESGAMSVLRDALAEGANENSDYKSTYERIKKHNISEEKIIRHSFTKTAQKMWKKKQEEYDAFVEALEFELG